MSIHLVTGYAGHAHVSAANHGTYNAGVIGPGRYVLTTGNQFDYTIESVNSIKIKDGDLIMDGRHITIEHNTEEAATIANGSLGMYRRDLIAVKYSVGTGGIETAEIIVIQGTAASSDGGASAPTYTAGNILAGDTTAVMPLYTVLLNGMDIQSVTKMFTVLNPIASIADLVYPVGSIYLSTSGTSPATLFGGTWQRIKDQFLLAAGDTYSAASTGGEAAHTLTASEMPAHTHTFTGSEVTSGNQSANHTHAISLTSGKQSANHTHGVSLTSGSTTASHKHSISLTSGATTPSHTHSISLTSGNQSANHTHAVSGNTGTQDTSHAHSVSLMSSNQSADHTHSVTAAGTISSSGSHAHIPTQDGQFYTTRGQGSSELNGMDEGGGFNQSGGLGGVRRQKEANAGSHTHTFTGSAVTSGKQSANHVHFVNGSTGNQSASHAHTISLTSGTQSANHTHTVSGNTASGGKSHTHTVSGNTADGGAAHTHTVSGNTGNQSADHTHTVSGNTGNQSANHNHKVTAAGTNANTGGGAAHNNMPPYLAVYVWKRTA